jgi:hypothetical protein
MTNSSNDRKEVVKTYQQRAPRYNLAVKLADVFAWFGFNVSGWRRQAIFSLNLNPGDTVVDIDVAQVLTFHSSIKQLLRAERLSPLT